MINHDRQSINDVKLSIEALGKEINKDIYAAVRRAT